jgi:hypothetical protein
MAQFLIAKYSQKIAEENKIEEPLLSSKTSHNSLNSSARPDPRLADAAEILTNFADLLKQQQTVESAQANRLNYINNMLREQDGGFADAMLNTIAL